MVQANLSDSSSRIIFIFENRDANICVQEIVCFHIQNSPMCRVKPEVLAALILFVSSSTEMPSSHAPLMLSKTPKSSFAGRALVTRLLTYSATCFFSVSNG